MAQAKPPAVVCSGAPVEGMCICNRDGHDYLACAESCEGRHSCGIAMATNLFDPYGERYEAIPHGGHNTFFRDAAGHWWSTFFGSDAQAPWQERPGVLPIAFSSQGRLQVLHAPKP